MGVREVADPRLSSRDKGGGGKVGGEEEEVGEVGEEGEERGKEESNPAYDNHFEAYLRAKCFRRVRRARVARSTVGGFGGPGSTTSSSILLAEEDDDEDEEEEEQEEGGGGCAEKESPRRLDEEGFVVRRLMAAVCLVGLPLDPKIALNIFEETGRAQGVVECAVDCALWDEVCL